MISNSLKPTTCDDVRQFLSWNIAFIDIKDTICNPVRNLANKLSPLVQHIVFMCCVCVCVCERYTFLLRSLLCVGQEPYQEDH